MRTILDLLTRLIELQQFCERVTNNPQLSDGEKSAALCSASLVRECLPQAVLDNYDRLKCHDRELFRSPDLFAMTVLVSTYVKLPVSERVELLSQLQRKIPLRGLSSSGRVTTPARVHSHRSHARRSWKESRLA